MSYDLCTVSFHYMYCDLIKKKKKEENFSVIHGYGILTPYPNHISGVMVSVLALSAVDRGFEFRSGQTKDYICVASPLSTQN